MLLSLLSAGGLVVAVVGGFFGFLTARSTARTERYRIAEAGLAQARQDTQAERDKILNLRNQQIDELTEMVNELRAEIVRLREALTRAGVTAP